MKLALIAAVARNGAIGKGNALLWHHPEDQRHFKQTTMGCPVIMGRKTWDSLPERFRPLPGRRNIVLTRNAHWQAPGAERAESLNASLALVQSSVKVFVIGGAQIYAEALPLADELVLTEIDADFSDADAFFPAWDREAFVQVSKDSRPASEGHSVGFALVVYQRKAETK
jgi:dihydrofolate reductase